MERKSTIFEHDLVVQKLYIGLSGKTTAAKILNKLVGDKWKVVAFSDSLKK